MNRERERPCWQQCRRTCSREQCYWARWWNRRVTLGTSTAHSARTLLLSSSPSCLLPPRDPFSPLLFFSLFSPCLSLNTLVLGSRSNSEHIYIDIYFKVEAKKEVRKKGIWVNGGRWDEMRWDEMMGLSHIHICCQRKFRRTRGGPGVKGVSEWSSLLCG